MCARHRNKAYATTVRLHTIRKRMTIVARHGTTKYMFNGRLCGRLCVNIAPYGTITKILWWWCPTPARASYICKIFLCPRTRVSHTLEKYSGSCAPGPVCHTFEKYSCASAPVPTCHTFENIPVPVPPGPHVIHLKNIIVPVPPHPSVIHLNNIMVPVPPGLRVIHLKNILGPVPRARMSYI